MPAHASVFEVRTRRRLELVNVTDRLAEAVASSGVGTGLACASVPHTTCALILNEDETGLREDLLRAAAGLIEPLSRGAPFAHDRIDHNAAAHLAAALFQPSLVVPVDRGTPALGTWQALFLVELDGPRRRTLRVTVL